jgi:hypothetical protein
MQWISIKDKLPKSGDIVFVLMGKDVAVSMYNGAWGFGADDSGYDIDVLDDSGLNVSLAGVVTYWMPIPVAPQDNKVEIFTANNTTKYAMGR